MPNALNTIIRSDGPTITDIVTKMRSNEYFVDNSFQRRLVWSEKQKVRLIETILIGFPMPEIYLWQQPAQPKSGKQRSSIVDGQQRLTAITQFIANEWPLKTRFLDVDNRASKFAGKDWKALPDELKQQVWDYVINVRKIPSSVADHDVRKVFRRLNETDRSLNPQELRHAEFSGPFIQTAEEIADLPIWKEWNFFSGAQIRRMQDIDFCNGLLVYLRTGVESDTAETLNTIYDIYNVTYKERISDRLTVKRVLKRIETVFSKSESAASLFKSVVHLYALFVFLHSRSGKLSDTTIARRLGEFATEYAKTRSASKLVREYRVGASYRTRSKASRERRIEALTHWVKQK